MGPGMKLLSFGLSAVLSLAGISSGVVGITNGDFKLTAIGLILIFGASVFAILHLGTVWVLRKRD